MKVVSGSIKVLKKGQHDIEKAKKIKFAAVKPESLMEEGSWPEDYGRNGTESDIQHYILVP